MREKGRDREAKRKRERERERGGGEGGAEGSFVCWLVIVPATCECISGTDLLTQFYVRAEGSEGWADLARVNARG